MITTNDAHALVIGISQYAHLPPLPPTLSRDARDVYALLIDPRHGDYPAENATLPPEIAM